MDVSGYSIAGFTFEASVDKQNHMTHYTGRVVTKAI